MRRYVNLARGHRPSHGGFKGQDFVVAGFGAGFHDFEVLCGHSVKRHHILYSLRQDILYTLALSSTGQISMELRPEVSSISRTYIFR